ncbi:hypothetical protein MMC06_001497 [Schaereria dolodes]|nr:hypothetical protein [Schaereria dolodes]
MPNSEQCLSPAWKFKEAPRTLMPITRSSERTLASMGIKDLSVHLGEEDNFNEDVLDNLSHPASPTAASSSQTVSVAEANIQAGLKWQAFTIQPFREEINRITAHYIAPGSPRELNLSHKDRADILHALQNTTHPSAFTPIGAIIETTLRNQSHPNFIRWSICNGNKPRVIFLRGFACMMITLGFVIAVLITLSKSSRWFRIFSAFFWWFGITNLIAAYKGLCVLLHRMHTRNIHPWELDSSETSSISSKQRSPFSADEESGYATMPASPTAMIYSLELKPSSSSMAAGKLSAFGNSNEFEQEPWIEKWKGQSVWRRMDTRRIWVQEEGLRIMQYKIVKQAHAWSFLITLPLTVVFVALPKGNLY